MTLAFPRLGTASIAALLALLPAHAQSAQPASDLVLDQVQLGDVWSSMQVDVPVYSSDVVSTASAVGNAAAGLVTSGDVNLAVLQRLEGSVTAENALSGYSAGTAIATTTAYGNAVTGGTWMGASEYVSDQISNGDVGARTDIMLAGANQIASATTAIANVSVPSGEYGSSTARQAQASNASVTASTTAVMCCDGVSATFATTAGGNAISATGWTTTTLNNAVQTTATGQRIAAATDIFMHDGNDVLGATSGFGNSATVHNQWGYAALGETGEALDQSNRATVDTQTYVTLDHWSGYASSSAYGVGNSALVSNIGSDTGLFAQQDNDAVIYTSADLTGNSSVGGTGIVTATSIGNAATNTLCNYCGSDAVLLGGVTQANSGQVIARGSATVPNAGGVYATATAVGNSATFQSTGN